MVTLVYLPGLDGTGKLFHRQELNLAPYVQVKILTLPLNDQSSWETLTAKVLELCPVGERVILCGESFGGSLALHVACQYPNLIQALVLVNPATSWSKQPLLSQGAKLLPYLPEDLIHGTSFFLMPFLAQLNRIAPADQRVLGNILRQVPTATISHRLALLAELPPYPRLTMPTLLVAGGADRLLPSVAEVRYLASYFTQAQVLVLPDSGHALLIESAVDLAQLLRGQGFLEHK